MVVLNQQFVAKLQQKNGLRKRLHSIKHFFNINKKESYI